MEAAWLDDIAMACQRGRDTSLWASVGMYGWTGRKEERLNQVEEYIPFRSGTGKVRQKKKPRGSFVIQCFSRAAAPLEPNRRTRKGSKVVLTHVRLVSLGRTNADKVWNPRELCVKLFNEKSENPWHFGRRHRSKHAKAR